MASAARRIDDLQQARVAVLLPRDQALAVARGLGAAGCVVADYADPVEALVDVLEGRFDAVVAGLDLPGLDGDTLCKIVRDRHGGAMAIVLVAPADDEEAIRRGLDAGADECVVAPPSLALLQARLRVHLRRRASQDESRRFAVLPPLVDPAPPCALDGYLLRGTLGTGSYGTVYDARRRDGLAVALKLLARDTAEAPDVLARFLREVGALTEVRSPRVVRVLATGYVQGRLYLVMERVEGWTADRLLEPPGRSDPALVARIGADVCAAIEALRGGHVVHRDVKPSNIIVGPDERATLVDFGLAKARGDMTMTRPCEIMGTAPYLAPEVINGDQPEDTGSDLYALGVTLWELLVGFRPFRARSDLELLETIAAGEPAPRVADVRPGAPGALSSIIERLMDPDPRRRLRDPLRAQAAFEDAARALGT